MSTSNLTGSTWCFGNDVDTDQIIPSQYLVLGSIEDMAAHCMETQQEAFAKEVEPGDFLVAGRNFGCGSSREQAPMVLKHLGVSAVIAESFSRIFFRNAINMGLMPIVVDGAGSIPQGCEMVIDLKRGSLQVDQQAHTFMPLDEYPQQILAAGGLINFIRKESL